MAQWYSRADRERMAQGLPPMEHSELTAEDYRDLLAFALEEAVEQSPAKDLVGSAQVGNLDGKYAAVTRAETDEKGRQTGKYTITVDWGAQMQARMADPGKGAAYVAHRLTSVYHEARHVEQKALASGILPVTGTLDMELATQTVVNNLYPTVFVRGYGNAITEVDSDVEGLEGALAFSDAHPELKERYGFDFRKLIMRFNEYDVLEDRFQFTEAEPEDLLAGMEEYRDRAYGEPWKDDRAEMDHDPDKMTQWERVLLERLEDVYGVTWDDLGRMSGAERNVLLVRNAMEAIDDPDVDLGCNAKAIREGPVMSGRLDEAARDENVALDLLCADEEAPEAIPWQAMGASVPDRGRVAAARLSFDCGPADAGMELCLG